METPTGTFGRYELKSQIGKGGMATVYAAYDPHFQRDVAIKLLPREFLHDESFRTRFEREARTLAGLEHAAIVPLHDFGEQDGQPFMVMRLMSGGSLSNRIARGPLPLDEAASIIERIGSALSAAHQLGLVHRDVKPSNILFDQHGDPFLADFGIVKLTEGTAQLTGSGILGTPAYMAPEMSQPGGLTAQVDVYALGVTLYQMLTGEFPFNADTPIGMIAAHLAQPIPDIRKSQPGLPADLQYLLERALAKDPAGRYATVAEMGADLKAIVSGKPVERTQTVTEPMLPPVGASAAPARVSAGVQAPPKKGVSPIALIVGGVLVVGVVGVLVVGGAALALQRPPSQQGDIGGQSPIVVERGEPAGSGGETLGQPPTDSPTPIPVSPPTSTPDYRREIEDAVTAFDSAMRYALQNCDTSQMSTVAIGRALEDRLNAVDIVCRQAGCWWQYDHRGLSVEQMDVLNSSRARVLALVDRSGTVMCPSGEQEQYAFPGPYEAYYMVDLIGSRWLVSYYCPSDDCDPDLLD